MVRDDAGAAAPVPYLLRDRQAADHFLNVVQAAFAAKEELRTFRNAVCGMTLGAGFGCWERL